MAKNPGKRFEQDFVKSIPDRCDITRLKDAGGWSKDDTLRFTSSNPCDLVVFSRQVEACRYGVQYKLELKSTLGKSLPFGNIKQGEEKRDKFIAALVASGNKGVWAGFIVNFRDTNETFAVLANTVASFIETSDRQSIPIAWFRENGRLIPQTLKISRYRYDLEWL